MKRAPRNAADLREAMWIGWLRKRYASGQLEIEDFEHLVWGALNGERPPGYAAPSVDEPGAVIEHTPPSVSATASVLKEVYS